MCHITGLVVGVVVSPHCLQGLRCSSWRKLPFMWHTHLGVPCQLFGGGYPLSVSLVSLCVIVIGVGLTCGSDRGGEVVVMV